MNRATITVNCNDRVIVHRNYGLYEDFSKAMAIYLMKYLYNSSYSPFNPESKYHYNNDENNYRFSNIDTNETIFDESIDTKIVNITITNTDNLFDNRYIIFENNILEKPSEWVLYDSIYKKILDILSRQGTSIESKIFRKECEISIIVNPKVQKPISYDPDDYLGPEMIEFNNLDIYRRYDKIVHKIFNNFSNIYPSEIDRAESLELHISYNNANPFYSDNETIFDSREEFIEEVANPLVSLA